MERLTFRTELGVSIDKEEDCPTCSICCNCDIPPRKCKYISDALEKLADYEGLEEQGRLLKLLCNRGDEVYFIKSAFSLAHFPIKAKITRICGVDCDNDVMYVSNTEYNGIDRHFKQSDIGKTVFLTKSEAEKKLKELRGNND